MEQTYQNKRVGLGGSPRTLACGFTLLGHANVWWPRVSGSQANDLMHMQRTACLSITGAMRTMPTAAMEAFLCVPPPDLFVEETAFRAVIKLRSQILLIGEEEDQEHVSIIHTGVAEAPPFDAAKDYVPPVFTFGRRYRVHVGPCVESLTSIDICTDGSKTKQG